MVEPTQFPVRFGLAATRQGPYMSTCTVPCTRRPVTRRPRLQGGQGIGFLKRSTPESCVCAPRPHIPRSCHRDSGLRLSGCLMSVDSVVRRRAARWLRLCGVRAPRSAVIAWCLATRRGAGPCMSPPVAGSREARRPCVGHTEARRVGVVTPSGRPAVPGSALPIADWI